MLFSWPEKLQKIVYCRVKCQHPVEYVVPLANPSLPLPKRHLDRFSRFCRAHERDQQTDRPHHAMCDICSNGPHLMHCVHAMLPNNASKRVGYYLEELTRYVLQCY